MPLFNTNNPGNNSLVVNETPGGSVNGANTTFTTASTYATNSLNVYKNGIRLKNGGADFTETASGFTMVTAPITGTVLLVGYNVNNGTNTVGTNSIITDEVPTGTVNGATVIFTTARAYIGGTLEVYINGLKQTRVTHFTETTPSSGTLTMSDAPLTGDVITVNYQYNLNPSSNADTVDGIHANTTATANQLLPLDANSTFSQVNIQTSTLGYAQITSNFTSTTVTTPIDVTSLTTTVTVPAGGRRIKVTAFSQAFNANGTVPKGVRCYILEDGTVINICNYDIYNTQAGYGIPMTVFASKIPSAGSHTYKVQMSQTTAGTMTTTAGATYPAFILVELI